jgi:hypothetical protein
MLFCYSPYELEPIGVRCCSAPVLLPLLTASDGQMFEPANPTLCKRSKRFLPRRLLLSLAAGFDGGLWHIKIFSTSRICKFYSSDGSNMTNSEAITLLHVFVTWHCKNFNGKGKVILMLNQALHHEGKWGSGGIAQPFLTPALDEGQWSASHLGCFTPEERSWSILWRGSLEGPRAGLDTVVNRNISCSWHESNPDS